MKNRVFFLFYSFAKVTALLTGLFISTGILAQLPTAQEIAAKLTIGWNLGNTLEVTWGNPGTTTKATIDSVKAAGFNTVRLPVAWFHHSDTVTSEINADWFESVKEVVDYCIEDGLYVIMNAHWDRGWLENRVNEANKALVNERQQAYWTQIANYFKDYDEHLLFAGTNEPNVEDAAGMEVLLSYHQTFINAVRATGGNNSSRTLVIQGPSTDIDKTNKLMNTLPTDEIENRLILEVHYYTPWNFCGLEADASWGKMFYYWGKPNHSATETVRNATWGEEADMDRLLGLMKTRFVDKGIPVIIGEYGAFRKKLSPPSDQELHNASVEYYYRYFMKSATKNGLITYCWDTGGIFNFSNGEIKDKVVVNAIMQGAKDAITNAAVMKDSGIELYPNPFNTAIILKLDKPEEILNISIFDIMGKRIETIGRSEITNTLTLGSDLNSGIYLFQINRLNESINCKVFKN